jgi:hypothetical protein
LDHIPLTWLNKLSCTLVSLSIKSTLKDDLGFSAFEQLSRSKNKMQIFFIF